MLSGTITGPIVAMLSGVIVSCALELRKHLIGYQIKDTNGNWTKVPGDWSSNVKQKFDTFWYGDDHEK
jgi:hypothetical protein